MLDLETELQAPDPGRRTRAVRAAVQRGDSSRLDSLVDLLEDPDVAVRIAAHGALRRLTGRYDDHYDPTLPAPERQPHVAAWRAWAKAAGGRAR